MCLNSVYFIYRSSGSVDVGESDGGIIPRAEYSAHEHINVWVSEVNTLGKIDSETLITNTHSISEFLLYTLTSHTLLSLSKHFEVIRLVLCILLLHSYLFSVQPALPSITIQSSDPLEIYWHVPDETEYTEWQCKVQYKKQCDQEWTEVRLMGGR